MCVASWCVLHARVFFSLSSSSISAYEFRWATIPRERWCAYEYECWSGRVCACVCECIFTILRKDFVLSTFSWIQFASRFRRSILAWLPGCAQHRVSTHYSILIFNLRFSFSLDCFCTRMNRLEDETKYISYIKNTKEYYLCVVFSFLSIYFFHLYVNVFLWSAFSLPNLIKNTHTHACTRTHSVHISLYILSFFLFYYCSSSAAHQYVRLVQRTQKRHFFFSQKLFPALEYKLL